MSAEKEQFPTTVPQTDHKRLASTLIEAPPSKRQKNNEGQPVAVQRIIASPRCALCPTVSRLRNTIGCTVCNRSLINLRQLEKFVDEFWRLKHPFDPSHWGFLLGVALQEQFPDAMRETARRTNLLDQDYINNTPSLPVVRAVSSTLAISAKSPLLVTTTEFLQLLGALHRAVPEYRINGMPADLWYQMLMFCHIEVLPRTFSEDESTFPMPTYLVEGKARTEVTTASCLYLHAQGYFYEGVQRKTRVLPSGYDARRLSPITARVVELADQAMAQYGALLSSYLLPSLVSLSLSYISEL